MTVLRKDLLQGSAIAVAAGVPSAVCDALLSAGARLQQFDERLGEAELEDWARVRAPLRAVVFDARRAFGRGGQEPLRAALEQAWASVRGLANGALISSPDSAKVVLVGPPPGAGRHAGAARSALENLARTLSVEWARFAVSTTAVMPGEHSTDEQLGELVSFLASAAGDYFSGCLLELGTVPIADAL
jgi:NAD(P)-dependent dehydrogenase (short-subunit alcohol dehydrogenase family)